MQRLGLWIPILLLLALALFFGCSSKPDPLPPQTGSSPDGTDEQIFVADAIEQNFDPHVILKRAESFFEKEDYPEAIIEYQHFLDMHRSHILASYAQFKLAEGHFKQARSIDRDTEPIKQALKEFQALLTKFPGSKYEQDALEKIEDCKKWIAETHLFVGMFYYKRESYLAAAHRFELVLNEYPNYEAAPEALYHLAMSYRNLGANEWAREQFTLLAQQYSNHKRRADSEQQLALLEKILPPIQMAEAPTNPIPESDEFASASLRTNSMGIVSPLQSGLASFNAKRTSTPRFTQDPPLKSSNPSFQPTQCRLDSWC